MRFAPRTVLLIVLGLSISLQAKAVPTTITAIDTPACDPLVAPTDVHELGAPAVFPAGEQIAAFPGPIVSTTPCPLAPNALTNNLEVNIQNLNADSFSAVYYVSNVGTGMTNIDGTINGLPAFQIDAVGVNTPLVAESGLADGIFSPGETWTFVIQDFANPVTSSFFRNIGVPDTNVPPTSSGSIVAVIVPEPGTGTLLVLGLLGLARRRRSNA